MIGASCNKMTGVSCNTIKKEQNDKKQGQNILKAYPIPIKTKRNEDHKKSDKSEEDEDILCKEHYRNSKPGENWIHCTVCLYCY